MSPMISVVNDNNEISSIDLKTKQDKKELIKIQEFIKKNFEYVGDKFSKKVREIYYDQKNNKTIYGTTTPEEREELADEGIEIFSIPWYDKEN